MPLYRPKEIDKNRLIVEKTIDLWDFLGKKFSEIKNLIPDDAILDADCDEEYYFFRFEAEETDEEYAKRLKNHEIAIKRYETYERNKNAKSN